MTAYRFTIEAGHACLDGHFPGAPIVPGVVILEHVGRAVARAYGGRVTRILRCKFVAGLEPEQACGITLEPDGERRLRFGCMGPDGEIAHGSIEWSPSDDG
ncbi:hypothetical protein V5738_08050 [Salinisphaera sp. SPP-AMP-43]|uniref:hypothetical protein n=1 Tax=Salinisphaera sp. SPP-AMP-43 TaxID=3121288 RepID=UPI003C6E8282